MFQIKRKKEHNSAATLNSQVSKLNKNKTEEENVASDDTLEEAPTITEELAKEQTVNKDERMVSDRIKNTKRKKIN